MVCTNTRGRGECVRKGLSDESGEGVIHVLGEVSVCRVGVGVGTVG